MLTPPLRPLSLPLPLLLSRPLSLSRPFSLSRPLSLSRTFPFTAVFLFAATPHVLAQLPASMSAEVLFTPQGLVVNPQHEVIAINIHTVYTSWNFPCVGPDCFAAVVVRQ